MITQANELNDMLMNILCVFVPLVSLWYHCRKPRTNIFCFHVRRTYIDFPWRRTQVAKGALCKSAMHRFESDRRLKLLPVPGWRNW